MRVEAFDAELLITSCIVISFRCCGGQIADNSTTVKPGIPASVVPTSSTFAVDLNSTSSSSVAFSTSTTTGLPVLTINSSSTVNTASVLSSSTTSFSTNTSSAGISLNTTTLAGLSNGTSSSSSVTPGTTLNTTTTGVTLAHTVTTPETHKPPVTDAEDKRLKLALGILIPVIIILLTGGFIAHYRRTRRHRGSVLLMDEDELNLTWKKDYVNAAYGGL